MRLGNPLLGQFVRTTFSDFRGAQVFKGRRGAFPNFVPAAMKRLLSGSSVGEVSLVRNISGSSGKRVDDFRGL
jgi:hypothetical protein